MHSIYLPCILRSFTASIPSNSAESGPPDEVTYWAYQIQDIHSGPPISLLAQPNEFGYILDNKVILSGPDAATLDAFISTYEAAVL